MHSSGPIDPGRKIDWGKTSEDYARHRPGPPNSFFERLISFGVGLPGQKILDLGTGTGVLARRFAVQGASVCGTDISENQITIARELAENDGLEVDFRVAPAEESPFADASFDVVTANQCWLYFDKAKVNAEVKRLLRPNGVLSVSHFSWLPRLDSIARESERLVLKHNPSWTASDWSGDVPLFPAWAQSDFDFKSAFVFDEPIPYTHESWLGRFRACRGVGASMSAQEVAAFDREHAELLKATVPASFSILHRIDAVMFTPKR
jgi:SAM-dependent methyltransferase